MWLWRGQQRGYGQKLSAARNSLISKFHTPNPIRKSTDRYYRQTYWSLREHKQSYRISFHLCEAHSWRLSYQVANRNQQIFALAKWVLSSETWAQGLTTACWLTRRPIWSTFESFRTDFCLAGKYLTFLYFPFITCNFPRKGLREYSNKKGTPSVIVIYRYTHVLLQAFSLSLCH
jgi:hypothetical protein